MEASIRLRTWRRSRDWTQEKLAELLGCKQSEVSAYEKGRKKPSVRRAAKIAKITGIKMEAWA